MGVSKHTGGIQMYGCIWTSPQSDKACFLFVVYVQQASKHLPNIHWGIQTYRSMQTYWRHPNTEVPKLTGDYQNIGASKHTRGASKYMGASKHRGIPKHTGRHSNIGGCPNIWWHSNIQRAIQTYGGIQTYSVHPHMLGHPNVWGIWAPS